MPMPILAFTHLPPLSPVSQGRSSKHCQARRGIGTDSGLCATYPGLVRRAPPVVAIVLRASAVGSSLHERD